MLPDSRGLTKGRGRLVEDKRKDKIILLKVSVLNET